MIRGPQHQQLVDLLVSRGGVDSGPSADIDPEDNDVPVTCVEFADWLAVVGPSEYAEITEDGYDDIGIAVIFQCTDLPGEDDIETSNALNEMAPEEIRISVSRESPIFRKSSGECGDAMNINWETKLSDFGSVDTNFIIDELMACAAIVHAKYGVIPNAPRIVKLLP